MSHRPLTALPVRRQPGWTRKVRKKVGAARCYPKNRISYPTEEAASEARAQYMARGYGTVNEIYRCPWGNHWHLTAHKEAT